MSLGELTSSGAVEDAIHEFDQIGRDAFLEKYGFGAARSFWLVKDDKRYDSKAIAGAAFGYQHPDRGPLRREAFSGGDQSVKAALERLGFCIEVDITAARLRRLFQGLSVATIGGEPAPHKPLLLLLSLRHLIDDQQALTPVSDLADELRARLITALPRVQAPSPWEPIWRLEPELWTLRDGNGAVIDRPAGSDPPMAQLRAEGVVGGFADGVGEALVTNPDVVTEIQQGLVVDYLGDVPRDAYADLLGASRRNPRVWWVNQGKTYSAERDGGYIWAPRVTKAGTPAAHHTAVSQVSKNDVVLHYSKGSVRALGRVTRSPSLSPRPDELPGELWGADGHRADIEYFELEQPINLNELDGRPHGAGPFTKNGAVTQGYLYELPSSWVPTLRSQFYDRWPTESPWGSSFETEAWEDTSVGTEGFETVVDAFATHLHEVGFQTGASGNAELVRTFVTSLAAKPFLILTGLSGSGKTKIAQFFGEWLGSGHLEIVAVRPDWTNPDSLLGYENGLSQLTSQGYAWNVPIALKFMLSAAHDPDRPYLLLLDEMNLAHVERYFADVLSGMESGHDILPNLHFANGEWRIADIDRPRLPLPPNLFVVGTVNVDETTYMFSPKVLDRANTIEFRVATSALHVATGGLAEAQAGPAEMAQAFLSTATTAVEPSPYSESVASALRDLHALLVGEGREFGHRTYIEALRFAELYQRAGSEDWKEALDLQVLQKVLPKLHGSIRELGPTLNLLGAWCHAGPGSSLQEGFEAADEGHADPALPRSFDKVQRMAKRLRANHFVSFAE